MKLAAARTSSSIEPLEARIAPALLINGGNLLGGSGNPTTGETSVGENAVTLVKVLSGQAIVWYLDGSITGISAGPNSRLDITGDVGDIIANLDGTGRLSDSNDNPSDGLDGAVLLRNNLLEVTTHPLSGQRGDVGSIVSGGSISNLDISGRIGGVYAGDGVYRTESSIGSTGSFQTSLGVDTNPVLIGEQSTFVLARTNAEMQAGASIKQAKINTARELEMFSGSGNPTGGAIAGTGPAGGNIEGITFLSAFVEVGSPSETLSYKLIAGDGANGKQGGRGGDILNVFESDATSGVQLRAGNGGNGSNGAGGGGGSIKSLDLKSDSASYTVLAGNGGTGAPGGAGGSVVGANFATETPNTGIIVAADFTGDGADDILVVDSGTGRMVISENSGDGSSFTQIVQYFDLVNGDVAPIVEIDGKGSTPSDAVAIDFDEDGDLDIVVGYKTSSNAGVFLNSGNGRFEYTDDDGIGGEKGTFDGFDVPLEGNVIKIAVGDYVGSRALDVVGVDVTNGRSTLHVATQGNTLEGEFALRAGNTPLGGPITDLVSGRNGALFASFASGSLVALTPAANDADSPFVIISTGVTIPGGISDLDIDNTGNQLLALSSVSSTLSLFDINGTSLKERTAPEVGSLPGRPVVAHFYETSGILDGIAVLSTLPESTRIDFYLPAFPDLDPATVDPAFILDKQLEGASSIKNFVPAYSQGTLGVAALGGSLSEFRFSRDLNTFDEYALPFAGKIIIVKGGNGGVGINAGKGGNGGSILGINAVATDILLTTGDGGGSQNAAGGSGGSIVNKDTLITASDETVIPKLQAESVLQLTSGKGGTSLGTTKAASGGRGGSITGFLLTLDAGEIKIQTGDGGRGNGGKGGAAGNVDRIETEVHGGSLSINTGAGGEATLAKAKAGQGGTISNLVHTLDLATADEAFELAYHVRLTTGAGGNAPQGGAGSGGSINSVQMTLDGPDRTYNDFSVPEGEDPLFDAQVDSTIRVDFVTGAGGTGATGGHGGSMSKITSKSVFDQLIVDEESGKARPQLNFVVMTFTSGSGGIGTAGNGGNGGTIAMTGDGALSGVTFFDPDTVPPVSNPSETGLLVTAGNGANGSTKGGSGGSILNVGVQNSTFFDTANLTGNHLNGARVVAGNGGNGGTSDGGKGGEVKGLSLGAEGIGFLGNVGTSIAVVSGHGGNGGGKGGAGGNVSDALIGVVNSVFDPNILVLTGSGGVGVKAGGPGGNIAKLDLNVPQAISGADAAILAAGDGGAATGVNAVGGKGGGISGVSHQKDITSSINLIEAGNGGASAAGRGGAGGNVATIKTVGFIGKPSTDTDYLGAFDEDGNPQGLYSGRGGIGSASDGKAGSVSKVSARQIAAIAAAADVNGLFGVASVVSRISADLIGYDVDRDGAFDSTGAGSPSQDRPIDGFILAAAISQVNNAFKTFNA